MKQIVLISGGFDPIHSGHIKLIQDASNYGSIVVLLNSDQWLRRKKGKEFLNFDERKIIMGSIKGVIEVLSFDDTDNTCINGIKESIIKYPSSIIKFANGGDRNNHTTPEVEFCSNNKVETIWGIGGNNKINSSSWILKKWNEK
jgi:D-beta-D-heptose 7-phosphate kinase/D-beta-D-heptose 1-phosphate adenosyltransferase|tara:strand:+ start:566 stop:997 length:432 start_codon:yes stop_codon:yes gene_type:complete